LFRAGRDSARSHRAGAKRISGFSDKIRMIPKSGIPVFGQDHANQRAATTIG
jgi:hypothetical protein